MNDKYINEQIIIIERKRKKKKKTSTEKNDLTKIIDVKNWFALH